MNLIEVKERFMSKVVKKGKHWLWAGPLSKGRYGQIAFDGKTWKAHRLSYLIHHGEFDLDRRIIRTCHVSFCVRPEHLTLGEVHQTHGCYDPVKGAKHYKARLTEAQVIEILASDLSLSKLAKKYGVGRSTIGSIKEGRSWKHIERKDVV